MRSDCIQAVMQAAGRVLTQSELSGIEQRVTQAMRNLAREDRDRWQGLSPSERVALAGDRAAKDLMHEKQLKALNVARQIVTHDRNQAFIDAQAKTGMRRLDALMHILMNYLSGKGGFRTLEANVEGVVRLAKASMEGFSQATSKYAGFFTNREAVRDVWRELYDPNSTGNAKARYIADLWTKTADGLRKQFNDLGGNIRQLKGWAAPQMHDALKVAKANVSDFVDFVLPRLNRDAYVKADGSLMSDSDLRALIAESKLSIATDGAWKGEVAKGSAIRNRDQNHRVLHFKDADSYLEYQKQFGHGSLLEAMNSHIEHMGRQIGALQTFGPNAEASFKQLLANAKAGDTAAGRPMDSGLLGKLMGREMGANKASMLAQTAFDIATGKLGAMGDTRVAHQAQMVRSWLSAARLGGAALSALTDSSNGVAVAQAWRIPALASWAKWESKAWSDPAFRAMMRSNGVGVEAIAHSISRYGEEVFGHGWTSNLANTVFRVSGLNFIDNVRRTATGAMLFDRIGQLAREHETLDAAHPGDVARLRDAGITDKHWEVWRQAAQEAGDDALLTPTAIGNLKNRSEAVRRDAMQALVGAVSRDVDTVVPMPTLKARTAIEYQAFGRRGTVGGEIARSILQFKSFPIAMISNHWQRMAAMPTTGGKIAYASILVATSTLLGALSIQLKSMVAGNNPQDMRGGQFAARAFMQGGSAGLYGDLIVGLYANPYKERLTDQMGPVTGVMADLYDVGRAVWDEAKGGQSKANVGGDVTRVIRGNTPFANLWWGKAAIDHAIFQRLQDYFSPGYAQRQQDRMQKYFGSTQWWAPSTAAAPSQLLSSRGITAPQKPNLRTAIGER